jgi:hypothetical protein
LLMHNPSPHRNVATRMKPKMVTIGNRFPKAVSSSSFYPPWLSLVKFFLAPFLC